MIKDEVSVYSFEIKASYPAIVTKISHDRVYFKISLYPDMKKGRNATFYVTGGNLNLFQIFKIGQRTSVKVKGVCRDEEIVVLPDILPIDIFIQENPIGSHVVGIITAITGATMLVSFGENIFCITKRCKHAKSKQEVCCKIHNYNPNKKALSIVVI